MLGEGLAVAAGAVSDHSRNEKQAVEPGLRQGVDLSGKQDREKSQLLRTCTSYKGIWT